MVKVGGVNFTVTNEFKKYFISDLHLGHKSILTLCNRRFNSIEEHDNYIINCINNTVSTADHLYILGDLGFHKDLFKLREELSKINTRNIHIIKGNHDNMQNLVQLKREKIICDVKEMQVVQKGRTHIFCCHYPMREWPGFWRGHYMAFGHTHSTLGPYEKSMDVGVDNIGFYPIEFDDLIKRIDESVRGVESKISKSDEQIMEYFPGLSTPYFVGLCTGNKEIRDKILEVLLRESKGFIKDDNS